MRLTVSEISKPESFASFANVGINPMLGTAREMQRNKTKIFLKFLFFTARIKRAISAITATEEIAMVETEMLFAFPPIVRII